MFSDRLSTHVTSLKIVSTYSKTSQVPLGEPQLLRATSHLSSFTQVESLTLAAVSFIAFDHGSLETCLGSLAATVRELKLSFCYLSRRAFFAFLRLFTHLDLLELVGNVWAHNPNEAPQTDPPTLRGSLTASEFTDQNRPMLDLFAAARAEYHTITLGQNSRSSFNQFNALFMKCKDHLKTLILTSPESTQLYVTIENLMAPNLSPCEELVGIQGRFYHSQFEAFIWTLQTIKSPRFRKLSLFIASPIPEIKRDDWAKLDAVVIALVKRVGATAVSDTLEVLFSSNPTVFGGVQLSEIQEALPLTASDARVSFRTEYLSLPLHP